MQNMHSKIANTGDPYEMLQPVSSHLGLHSLLMSYLWIAGHEWAQIIFNAGQIYFLYLKNFAH